MHRALSNAASGMEAQELRVSIISNNLANVSTTGFKKSRPEFQDVLYDTMRPAALTNTVEVPAPLEVGQGVRPVATLRQYSMGDLTQTTNPLDVAIEGQGFFQIRQLNGDLAYTRDGTLKTDSEGRVVTADGLPLDPPIHLPPQTTDIIIGADGTVSVTRAGDNVPVEVGEITLANFANPAGLKPLGHNLLEETSASGTAVVSVPGTQATGALAQGFLEMSNVKVVEEMIELIATQRAYEVNSKVIQAADEMLRTTVGIR